jgi:hypothetical protein
LIIFLSIFCAILLFLLVLSVRKNLEFSERFENVVDKIEESLDVLDACYNRASIRAKLEVLSDEPVVRELLDDIQLSRDAVLLVANLLVEPLQDEIGKEMK